MKRVLLSLLLFATFAGAAEATGPGANGSIAFRRYFNADHSWGAVFTMNADGTDQRQITHPVKGTFDDQPDWAPDGSLIAFTRCRPDPYPCLIFTMNPMGGRLRQLGPCPPGGKQITQCTNDSTAQFSPDSKQLVFTEARGPVKKDPAEGDIVQHSSIAIMNVDGSGRHVVYRGAPYSSDLQYPVFSPDGKRVVFERANSSFAEPKLGKALFVVNIDGTGLQRITPWAERDGDNPDWSPDGQWILFRTHQEDPTAQSQFAIIHPDGSGERVLTRFPNGTHVASGSFAPDGTSITFAKGPEGGNIDVFTMSLDGTHVVRLTTSPLWDSAPDWGPTHSSSATRSPASARRGALNSSCAPRTLAYSSTVDLTGAWSGDDGAIMYLTESGKDIWWVSMSGQGRPLSSAGRDFTNVGRGTRAGARINAQWIDTPRGQIYERHTARIVFKIVDRNGATALAKLSSTGGYGGTLFVPCSERRP